MARLALFRAGERQHVMNASYMIDLRTEHVHQLYNNKGGFISNDSSVKTERKMAKQYERLVHRQKNMELMYSDLVLSQDLFNTRYRYIGEKLVDVVQKHKGVGMECICMMSSGSYRWRSDCDRCFIPGNVLTTITLPNMVSQVGTHIYLVEYWKGGMIQVCAPDGIMITLGWNEAAAIAWCAYAGSLSKRLIANTKFAIPLGYRKKLIIDTATDTYELHGPSETKIPFPSYESLAKLQGKCRDFGFRSGDVCKLMPFIPHFFHKM